VLFWDHDIRQFDKIIKVYDDFKNITFVSEHEFGTKRMIKECGVFPNMPQQGWSWLVAIAKKLLNGNAEKSELEALIMKMKNREQLLSTTKRMRTSP